jgi:hypothetical protein
MFICFEELGRGRGLVFKGLGRKRGLVFEGLGEEGDWSLRG